MAEQSMQSFLEKLGMEADIEKFRNKDIDIGILQKMTMDDFKLNDLTFEKGEQLLDALKTKGMPLCIYIFFCLYLYFSYAISSIHKEFPGIFTRVLEFKIKTVFHCLKNAAFKKLHQIELG